MSNDFKDMLAEIDSDQKKRDAKRTECRLCGSQRPKFNTFEEWKAIGYRVSWPDQWLTVVPLESMARVSRERNLIRTTLYVVSPALRAAEEARSLLYSASHNHLFRGGAE